MATSFNPSSWGSFAPSFMSPAASSTAQPSGAPAPGAGSPVSPVGQAAQAARPAANPNANSAFNYGMKLLMGGDQQQPPQLQQIQFARPLGAGKLGMLG